MTDKDYVINIEIGPNSLGGKKRFIARNTDKIYKYEAYVEYEINNIWYSEEEFQRILKMKSFI